VIPNHREGELPYDLRTERNEDPIQALEARDDALVQKGVKFIDGDIVDDRLLLAFERTARVGAGRPRLG